jgi:hypothetical protein
MYVTEVFTTAMILKDEQLTININDRMICVMLPKNKYAFGINVFEMLMIDLARVEKAMHDWHLK